MLVDILQIVVPSLIGVVAPILLYMQSPGLRSRGEDRQLERKADEQRRETGT